MVDHEPSRLRTRVVDLANRTSAAIGRHEDAWRVATYGTGSAGILRVVFEESQRTSITGGVATAVFMYGLMKGIDIASGYNKKSPRNRR